MMKPSSNIAMVSLIAHIDALDINIDSETCSRRTSFQPSFPLVNEEKMVVQQIAADPISRETTAAKVIFLGQSTRARHQMLFSHEPGLPCLTLLFCGISSLPRQEARRKKIPHKSRCVRAWICRNLSRFQPALAKHNHCCLQPAL